MLFMDGRDGVRLLRQNGKYSGNLPAPAPAGAAANCLLEGCSAGAATVRSTPSWCTRLVHMPRNEADSGHRALSRA